MRLETETETLNLVPQPQVSDQNPNPKQDLDPKAPYLADHLGDFLPDKLGRGQVLLHLVLHMRQFALGTGLGNIDIEGCGFWIWAARIWVVELGA